MLIPLRRTTFDARVSHTRYGSVTRRSRLVLAMFAGFALDGCKDSSGPDYGPPAQLLITAGASQTGVFRQPTAIVPMVQVTDAQGRSVPKVIVTFLLQSGGGTITASTDTTDANGNATPGTWTLGSTFGQKTLTASVNSLQSVSFTATAIAPDAGIQAFSLTDATGDTLGNNAGDVSKAHDVVQLRGEFKRDSLILTWTYAGSIASGSAPLLGFIEIDVDDNLSSGFRPYSNDFGATANLGVDYWIVATNDPAAVLVVLSTEAETALSAVVTGSSIVIRVPMRLLGNDDGNFGVVGVVGTDERATDVFPNAGATLVRPTGAAANSSASSRQRIQARSYNGKLPRTWRSLVGQR